MSEHRNNPFWTGADGEDMGHNCQTMHCNLNGEQYSMYLKNKSEQYDREAAAREVKQVLEAIPFQMPVMPEMRNQSER